MPRTFRRQHYGRIYVCNPEHVEKVKAIIVEMDEFESFYLPPDMVAPFSEYPEVVYTHKFDGLDLDALTATCFDRGYPIWAFEPLGDTAYPRSLIKSPNDGSGAAS